MSVVNFSIKNLLQHDRQRSRGKSNRERERGHLLFAACIQHMHDSLLGIFNASCAEGTFYDVI
jgi:hypothetical protein